MLVGYDKILDLCIDFIEDNITDDIESVDLSTDFYCYPNTKEIYISVLAPATALDDFITNLETRTQINDISVFTWSFLHEVGHCMTWNYLNKRTQHHCEYIKRKIERGSLDYLLYYALADEKIATDWAIGFVENNHKLVKAFDRMVMNEITNFYINNEIDLEG
jgi:hypothetical protein